LTLARRGVSVSEVANLNDIIEEYLKSPEYEKLQRYHPEIDLHVDLAPELLNLTGSPVHLGKTVMNLISNAAEACDKGGQIRITTRNRYIDSPIKGYDDIEEGDYVVLRIVDDGVGISAEDIHRIFEPFYTKKVMGRSGTGLGMAVVWGTVKDHQGYIDMQSEQHRGTMVTVYLPATREEGIRKKSADTFDLFAGRGEHILVVDDVAEQREIAKGMLTKLGYSVEAMESGEAALEYMADHPVDILVLDMIMDPGIDGLETYRRAVVLHPGQRAVITSGFSESDRVRRAQSLGAGSYVKKPYRLESIAKAIREELDR
jgi:CheY-like chemotaxis protein